MAWQDATLQVWVIVGVYGVSAVNSLCQALRRHFKHTKQTIRIPTCPLVPPSARVSLPPPSSSFISLPFPPPPSSLLSSSSTCSQPCCVLSFTTASLLCRIVSMSASVALPLCFTELTSFLSPCSPLCPRERPVHDGSSNSGKRSAKHAGLTHRAQRSEKHEERRS
ncbi:unnamed protein product [Pleuronectes platessa]|uniref:Transmembrane protein n=1 Tax=Pleuronectes platessa TaxID=8262 RepID=A0A9N7UJA0_PLEPL|nr:unnamed protein product [Pleuronectes platessa]